MIHFLYSNFKTVFCWSLIFCALSCKKAGEQKEGTLFSIVPSSESDIDFENILLETNEFNIIEYLYFYNGGGVSAGDINNDGLVDLYFSSNQNSNKLYLNKGDWKFEDITEKAGVAGVGNWKTGVTMADVNADGLLDIYICGVGNYKKFSSRNQLLINNGDLTFSDQTNEFGLNFQGLSTQAAFFDFDLDGDLDCYLLNHSVHSTRSYGSAKERNIPYTLGGDKLFKNDRISDGRDTGKVFFKEVTHEAGIYNGRLGYGLGLNVSDINMDGFPDIYVSNDFQENDYLYLNRKDGTFREIIAISTGHTSRFSMGNDVADINNDLLPDIITLDMLPSQEDVIKTSAGDDPYEIYMFKLKSGFHFQTAHNCLQLSQSVSDTSVLFSDIATLARVEATDWSWSPLLADFDNDGYKDLFISNGILRRPNDMDYINFISDESVQKDLQQMSQEDLKVIKNMPSGKVSNVIFQNNGYLQFEDRTLAWGIDRPSISNGMTYADLDNDGDLDLVANNLNEKAFLYRNNSTENKSLTIISRGSGNNTFGLGMKAIAFVGGMTFYNEVNATRAFSSSVDTRLIIGLGNHVTIDSLLVIWPSGKFQSIQGVNSNQQLVVEEKNASGSFNYKSLLVSKPLLEKIISNQNESFKHRENSYNAFNYENLMPQMLAAEGPPIAVADVNRDGLDDYFVGGGRGQASVLFQQDRKGNFKWKQQKSFERDSSAEDIDASFFDADGDGDDDLIVVSGGQELSKDKNNLQPRLYLNDGKGLLKRKSNSIKIFLNASCVKPNDFDGDGDIDIFIGASTMPLLYGMSPTSYLLQNDGYGNFNADPEWLGNSHFTNMPFNRPGMVKDAVWTDINKDGLPDLVLVGEWMPITILEQQQNHKFINKTNTYGLQNSSGWWNTVSTADIDLDGDLDLIAGNMGLNSRLNASEERPLKMILGDLDGNRSSDHILIYYNGDKSYPFASRDQLAKQLPYLKKKFLKYSDYRNVTVDDIISPAQKSQTTELRINELRSVFVRNDGMKLTVVPLPIEAQFAPVQTIFIDDVNSDGNLDALIAGNLSAVQTELGPYDGSLGLVMLGDGKGNFKSMSAMASGFVIQGEARGIEKIQKSKNGNRYLVSRNNKPVVQFKINNAK